MNASSMNASSLQQLNELRFYVCGNVTVHPDASIASNVFLQADPDSHLMIGARVVIGPQSILHVSQGSLTIGNDVTIGTQVLIVGEGTIGEGACIGSFSTLLAPVDVQSQHVIPPRSLIGDASRVVALDDMPSTQSSPQSASGSSTSADPSMSSSEEPSSNEASPPQTPSATHTVRKTVVYGRASVEKMIQVMFPYKDQSLNGNTDHNTPNGMG